MSITTQRMGTAVEVLQGVPSPFLKDKQWCCSLMLNTHSSDSNGCLNWSCRCHPSSAVTKTKTRPNCCPYDHQHHGR